jgi:fluoroquinolone transport system permease protein
MSRLLPTLQMDLRLQQRYGFYYAGAFVALVWIVILRQLPAWTLPLAVPFLIFVDLGVVGFYFIAGTVLFEKAEATLFALVITPLCFWEYLAAKLATLTLLALVLTVVVVVPTYGVALNWFFLLLGVTLTSLLVLLVGFISVAPYTSISEYLLPSQLYFLVINLPLAFYFDWLTSPVFYLIPTQGSLLLLRAAFEPIEIWQILYAIFYQLLWIGVLVWWARQAFDQHIVVRKGGR